MSSWLSRSCEIEEHSTRFSRVLPIAPLGPSSPGTTRRCESADWYTRQPERDEKDLPFPVKRVDARRGGAGYTHPNAIRCSSLPHPLAPSTSNVLWKMAPITRLTPADPSCWPPHLIAVAVPWPFNLPRKLTHGQMCPKHPKVPYWCPRGTFRLIMGIGVDSNVHFLN